MTTTQTVARLEGATRRFGDVLAVDDVNLEIRSGEIVAVLGPNGAGKTTSINLLLGLDRPDRGSATLFDHKPTAFEARCRTGVMLQIANIPEMMSVVEHIELFRTYYHAPLKTESILETAGLASLRRRRFGALSGGEKQRVMFALAICGDPDLVFLDEPTVGLDVEARRGLWASIRGLKERGKTVVLTTHYLDEADSLADRIVLLQHGRVLTEGTPFEIKSGVAAKKIRCRTALGRRQLELLPGATDVRIDEHGIEILSANPESTVLHLLQSDSSVTELAVSGASLEEAFLSLTTTPTENNKEAA